MAQEDHYRHGGIIFSVGIDWALFYPADLLTWPLRRLYCRYRSYCGSLMFLDSH